MRGTWTHSATRDTTLALQPSRFGSVLLFVRPFSPLLSCPYPCACSPLTVTCTGLWRSLMTPRHCRTTCARRLRTWPRRSARRMGCVGQACRGVVDDCVKDLSMDTVVSPSDVVPGGARDAHLEDDSLTEFAGFATQLEKTWNLARLRMEAASHLHDGAIECQESVHDVMGHPELATSTSKHFWTDWSVTHTNAITDPYLTTPTRRGWVSISSSTC